MNRPNRAFSSARAATLLCLFFAAAFAGAQTVPLDVELGFRFLDLTGSKDMYRSQIDERQGFLLRSLTFATAEADGHGMIFDRLRFDVTDIGVGPNGGFRLELGRGDLYRLRTTYQKQEMFSALPAFANPLLESGVLVVPGQHTYDRERHRFDADFELFPGGSITPLVGYSRNTYSGPGTTTYTVGQDEFRLTQDLRTIDEEIRGGASFQAGPVSGQVIQGWRKFRSDEHLTLAPGEGNGNNSGAILGVPVTATAFNRQTNTEVDTPTTSAVVTGRFLGRVRVVGSYTRARGSSDTNEQEDGAGNLVSFEISRFFRGFSDPITSNSKATQWTGLGRVEVGIVDGIDFEASYTRRHRDLDGFALISSLFLNTSTFTGVSTGDIARILEANTAIDRTDTTYEAGLSARGLGPVSLRGSYSQTNQDLTVTADPSEIVVPGGQGGDFKRIVKSFHVAATYAAYGFTAGGEYRNDRGNIPIVRTDFNTRDVYRLRVGWGYKDIVKISATGEQTDIENEDPAIALDGRVRRYGGDLDVTPWKPLHVRFSASKYQADNTTLIRRPETFVVQPSVHREDGTSYEGSVGYVHKMFQVDAGYGWFENKGLFPFAVNRVRSRLEVPVGAGFSGVFEWFHDKYSEQVPVPANVGNYSANRYGVYVHFHL
jgi:hypothetical protein